MRFISLLIKSSLPVFLVSCISSALTGVFSTLVIKSIHQSVTGNELALEHFILTFSLYMLGYAAASLTASYSVARLTQSIIHKLRQDLSRKILGASFESVEKAQPKLLAILTEDIKTIALSMDRLPGVATGVATVTGILAYLIYYSPLLTLATVILFVMVFLFTKLTLPFVKKYSDLARQRLNDLYTHFEGLVFGIKELTLNARFKESYLSREIIPTSRKQNEFALKESVISAFANRITDLVLFLGLGVLIVIIYMTRFVELEFFGEYLTLVLFTLAPLSTASGFLSSLKRIETSLDQIESIGLTFDDEEGGGKRLVQNLDYEAPKIELDEIRHAYYNEDGKRVFELGPVSLQVHEGEVVFLVGGNGSGKTTLAKIISGLYRPKGGTIRYHGKEVDDHTLRDFRSQFAAVFSDSYVFEHLHHISAEKLEEQGEYLVELLELTGKVAIVGGRFTTKKLSDGQRKRLSLIQAILEDKEIYLLDEWAAHQDPHFKEIFYNKIIPYLREQGKTILVITHDDRYFHTADKIVKMQDGKALKQDQITF